MGGKLKLLFAVLSLCLKLTLGYGQENKASLQIDTAEIKIGEQIKAVLKVEVDTASDVRFPSINKFLTDQLEVVEVSDLETQKINGTKILTKTLKLTSFDSGNHHIPPFNFIIKNANESIDTIFSSEEILKVRLLPVDTTAAIKDTKEPIDTPFKGTELWAYLNYLLYAIILLVVVLIGVQYLKLNKAKPKPAIVEPPKIEAPEVIALKELESLKKRKNWENPDGLKDFYEDLSIILRKYIQGRFKMHALERTSNEILKDISNRAIDREVYSALYQVLILSDFVKYAKYNALKEENNKSLENAFLFVNKTKGAQIVEQKNV